ncbi:MAG: tRNA-dihydrouridine synthase [Rhizomicrobium sp.]
MADALRIGSVSLGGRVLLAPMASVSDLPFRRTAARLGAVYAASEMVACTTLAQGRADMVHRAAAGDGLPLMVLQIAARTPEDIAMGAGMAEAAGADIIDINMGCPSREVVGGLSGAALMRDLGLACQQIEAAVGATSRPVTVKMRLGWDDASRNAPELAAMAERCGAAALTVHGRTRNQFYKGHADWAAVAAVKAATTLPVIVNGDIVDANSARMALAQSGADAVMVGRAAVGRPWIAGALDAALRQGGDMVEPDAVARLNIAIEHLRDSQRFYGAALGLRIFRKHLAGYIDAAPWPGDDGMRRQARGQICQLKTGAEVETALTELWRVH